jgi:hypothetical protein
VIGKVEKKYREDENVKEYKSVIEIGTHIT